ncbi:MAG TPA: tRNA pseudouridine(38-40) synthase TruA [Steroidobacteraceae bacterium]|nr:tRNA pseudouridine(38-40) synthase TruA [Steroidobacteraceae bacterium]
MPRIAVGLEYHGGAYAGWQLQPGLRTLQGVLQEAFGQVAAEPVTLSCAGRTDAGVHAVGQVAHFDTEAVRTPRGWALGANTYLPLDASVRWAREVPGDFHARHSAASRTYCYLIANLPGRSALACGRATVVHVPLDVDRMREAARLLCGEHDFSAFRAAECQARTPVRRLEVLTVERQGEWIAVRATANAFLHHMVRNISGLLIAVGQGKAPPLWAREVLESRDRTRGAATAPPDGLYLWGVRYPDTFDLPATPGGSAWAMIPGLPGFSSLIGSSHVVV